MDYERFDGDAPSSKNNGENGSAEISLSAVVSVSSSAKIEDTQIQVDDISGPSLTIYNAETKEGLEYIDDPSRKPQLHGLK